MLATTPHDAALARPGTPGVAAAAAQASLGGASAGATMVDAGM
jgi:hypothetical protein